MGDFQEKDRVIMQIALITLSGTVRETPLQIAIPLRNVNVSYERVISSGFQRFSGVCHFLKITSSR